MPRMAGLRRFLFWTMVALFGATILVVGIQTFRILVLGSSPGDTVFGSTDGSQAAVLFYISVVPGVVITLATYLLLRRRTDGEELARTLGFFAVGGTFAVSLNVFLSGIIVEESPLGMTSVSQNDLWEYKVGFAPVIEEIAKTLALIAVPWMLRGYNPNGSYRIPSVYAGTLYGFVVGGFFAGFETYFYSANALVGRGLSSGLETAMLRTVGTVGHLAFTGLAGAAVSFFLIERRNLLIPASMLVTLVGLHALMNYLAAIAQTWMFLVVPGVGLMLVVLVNAMRPVAALPELPADVPSPRPSRRSITAPNAEDASRVPVAE